MSTNKTDFFFEKINELIDIPDRLALIKTCMTHVEGFTNKDRDIIVNVVDASIILSFCKVVGKNYKAFEKALSNLEKENPELYNKVSYFKTVRDKVIAHIDLEDWGDRICLDFQAKSLGNTFDEVQKSYNDILEWMLEVLGIRDYFKATNEKGEKKIPQEVVENISINKLFEICRKVKEQEKNIISHLLINTTS